MNHNVLTRYKTLVPCMVCKLWTSTNVVCQRHLKIHQQVIESLQADKVCHIRTIEYDLSKFLFDIRQSSPVVLRVQPKTGLIYSLPANQVFLESKRTCIVLVVYYVRAARSVQTTDLEIDFVLPSINCQFKIVVNGR